MPLRLPDLSGVDYPFDQGDRLNQRFPKGANHFCIIAFNQNFAGEACFGVRSVPAALSTRIEGEMVIKYLAEA
jgi:hypothetical protein